jgi:hypothetical protein
MKAKLSKPDSKSQSARFIEAAREGGVDESRNALLKAPPKG